MAVHNVKGKEGEELAVQYFTDRGYDILFRNWRFSKYEIDIIAEKDSVLHIIEVKLLASKNDWPEEGVSKKKIKNLMIAAEAFVLTYDKYSTVQFDILAINHHQPDPPSYFLIEDIYYYS